MSSTTPLRDRTVSTLKKDCARRGITVRSTGTSRPLKDDYIRALRASKASRGSKKRRSPQRRTSERVSLSHAEIDRSQLQLVDYFRRKEQCYDSEEAAAQCVQDILARYPNATTQTTQGNVAYNHYVLSQDRQFVLAIARPGEDMQAIEAILTNGITVFPTHWRELRVGADVMNQINQKSSRIDTPDPEIADIEDELKAFLGRGRNARNRPVAYHIHTGAGKLNAHSPFVITEE